MENYQALKFKCLPVPAATYKIREKKSQFFCGGIVNTLIPFFVCLFYL